MGLPLRSIALSRPFSCFPLARSEPLSIPVPAWLTCNNNNNRRVKKEHASKTLNFQPFLLGRFFDKKIDKPADTRSKWTKFLGSCDSQYICLQGSNCQCSDSCCILFLTCQAPKEKQSLVERWGRTHHLESLLFDPGEGKIVVEHAMNELVFKKWWSKRAATYEGLLAGPAWGSPTL